jgi:DNA polymerase I-like protein with 3'-5' exonuclease and polymerase domains
MSSFFDLSTITKVAAKATTTKIYDCSHCKAFLSCKTPKIPVQGEGKLGILIVLDEVSLAQENSNNDRQGSHFLFLKKRLKDLGVDIHKDCWTVNAIRCYISDKKPGAMMLSGCGQLLTNDIKRLKPKGIIITSELGWDVVFSNRLNNSRADGSLWDYAGAIIPDQELKVWLFPIYSTHLIIEADNEVKRKQAEYGPHWKGSSRFEPFYTKMLSEALININTPVPIYEYESKVKKAKTVEEAISFIKIAQSWPAFAFDYETTGLAWHRKEQQIHSVAYSNGEVAYSMTWYKDNPTFMSEVKRLYQNDAVKIAQNKAFERSWSIGRAYQEPNNLIHDPMLMAHAYMNLAPTGLKHWLARIFGILGYDDDAEQFLKPPKEEVDKYGKNAMNTIFSAPKDKILLYVGLDSLFTYWLAQWFQKRLDPEHQMPGYKLLARGERPLTHMHLTGLRVDLDAIKYWKPVLQARIDEQYTIIMDSDIIKSRWVGGKFKPGSDTDLRRLVYDILKFKPTSFTDKGLPSVDADALDGMIDKLPIAVNLLEYRRWYKLLYTFITGLEREQWDGIIHPYLTLNNVDTYRSASRSINLQNIPKHDKEVMKVIRSLFLPHKGQKLSSCDFAQLEVRANAGITRDKNLVKAVQGSMDMHTEMSKKLFMLEPAQTNKKARNVAKTNVFRLFYGGSGEQMAEGTWKIINSRDAEAQLGMDMVAHIRNKGISSYEQWVEHCKRVDHWLWNDLFPDYQKWRKESYNEYLKRGYIHYPNGFTYQGVASRNSLLNGPGQGAGFHVNLCAIIGIFEELEARDMKSKLVIQIHDDDMGSVEPSEEELYKQILYRHMVTKQKEYNPWMNGIPLEVEFGITDNPDESWDKIKEVGVLTGE